MNASNSRTAGQLVVLMAPGGVSYFAVCAAMGMNVLEHVKRRRATR